MFARVGSQGSWRRATLMLALSLLLLSACLDVTEARPKRARARNQELSGDDTPASVDDTADDDVEVRSLDDEAEDDTAGKTGSTGTPSRSDSTGTGGASSTGSTKSAGTQASSRSRTQSSEEYYDDDEFEGVPMNKPPTPHKAAKAAKAKKAPAKPAAAKVDPVPAIGTPEFFKYFMYECIALVVIIFYIILYYIGKSGIEKQVFEFVKLYDELFRAEFAEVGITSSSGSRSKLLKESVHEYKYYATGRRNCTGMLASFDFKARQDLVSILWDLWKPSSDRLTIDIPVKDMEPFVFLAVQSRIKRTVKEENEDLANLGQEVAVDGLPGIAVHTDVPGLVSDFLSKDVQKALNEGSKYFLYMHFSDSIRDPKNRQRLRFVFKIPPKNKMAELKTFMRMIVHLIDKAADVKLSAMGRDRCRTARLKLEQKREKARLAEAKEEAERKRQEKAKKQKEEARRNLDLSTRDKIEAQKRKEEKERKKKKKQSGMKLKVMKM